MKTSRTFALSLLGVVVSASMSMACSDYEKLTTQQIRISLGELKNKELDDFSRYLAYQSLTCSDDSIVRELGRTEALRSGVVELQSAVFWDRLSDMEYLILEPDPNVEMTEDQIKYSKSNSHIRLALYKALADQKCIALSSQNDCRRNAVLSVNGLTATISSYDQTGFLELQEDGTLRGFWFPSSDLRIPIVANF